MKKHNRPLAYVNCPFCNADQYCPHFLGWTTDGKTVDEPRRSWDEKQPIQPGDRIVTTGVSARVYRPEGGAE